MQLRARRPARCSVRSLLSTSTSMSGPGWRSPVPGRAVHRARPWAPGAGVGEDGYYSAAEEDLSFTSSPGREEGSEKLVEMAHNPMGDHSGSHQVRGTPQAQRASTAPGSRASWRS